jgi:hypothetical protein
VGRSLWVIDYKSDVLTTIPRALMDRHVDEHYRLQYELYAVAVARMLGLTGEEDRRRRFGGLLYWFLRPGHVVHASAPGPISSATPRPWPRGSTHERTNPGAVALGRGAPRPRRRGGRRRRDLFRRLGVGARRCDLGDAGLYLAEELVAWNRFLGAARSNRWPWASWR